jgi:hypothetical protein
VFFVGVDTLAAMKPDLFDKYLYVGTTRGDLSRSHLHWLRATEKIEPLRGSFITDWKS